MWNSIIFAFTVATIGTLVSTNTFAFPLKLFKQDDRPHDSNLTKKKKSKSLIRTQDFDSHHVITSDGITLNLLHLVRGFTVTSNEFVENKPTVYLQHGLFDSSDTWLLNGPNHSLAYMLASRGYDVWIGNSRGNQYSPTTDANFTWDDMATKDLPSFIHYIKKQVNHHSKISIIGHSQGAVMILASLIESSISASDLSRIILLSPPASLRHQRSKFLSALATMKVDEILNLIPNTIFIPTINFLKGLINKFDIQYDDSFKFMFGESNLLLQSNFQSHFPSPTSGKNVAHWIQSVRTGKFQRFAAPTNSNHDSEYDVLSIPKDSIQVVTFYGSNDLLVDPRDIKVLNDQLSQNNNLVFSKGFEGYAHMDFTWSLDAAKTVYPLICNLLD